MNGGLVAYFFFTSRAVAVDQYSASRCARGADVDRNFAAVVQSLHCQPAFFGEQSGVVVLAQLHRVVDCVQRDYVGSTEHPGACGVEQELHGGGPCGERASVSSQVLIVVNELCAHAPVAEPGGHASVVHINEIHSETAAQVRTDRATYPCRENGFKNCVHPETVDVAVVLHLQLD